MQAIRRGGRKGGGGDKAEERCECELVCLLPLACTRAHFTEKIQLHSILLWLEIWEQQNTLHNAL